MSNRNHRTKVKKILDASARQRGIDREKHFANGGTLAEWRGISSTIPDKKKRGNKKACRGEVDE